MPNLICFDCETESFCPDFSKTKGADRLKAAPRLRLCCTFDGDRWRDFWPAQAADLVTHLTSAPALLSFNGIEFDEFVLRRHAGLKGNLPRSGRHFDLCAELAKRDTPRSLNALARLNLNEGKMTKGAAMHGLDGPSLVEACRSDVSQTWRLWELWQKGELRIPERQANHSEPFGRFEVGPGHHASDTPICPICGDVNSIELVDMDVDDMSDAQAADYEAGMWGVQHCTTCGADFDYGF